MKTLYERLEEAAQSSAPISPKLAMEAAGVLRNKMSPPKILHVHFKKTVEYPVTVEIPDGVRIVEEHGETYVVVARPIYSNGPLQTMKLSLQVAAKEGLVLVTEWRP